jgi:hypothetical protein
MQHHRIDGWPAHVAAPASAAHHHQRRLVLELAVAPPAGGDDPADLARVLGFPRAAIERAADGLIAAGLAERHGGRLFASAATLALDALWPMGR